ncbi:phosphatase PAP2 family protein [Dyella telluris]|uniref:Phosphatase PAP2 family protein n=1 Tax=Dyella telluris TaxID=2763498 RepID=A0A7G8PZR7_9GAMM|nr:phosphatase PAP2 family protein [Dyella telluris]QNK00025.1 phosphatase PAP2 family protein [Dyella telluris]
MTFASHSDSWSVFWRYLTGLGDLAVVLPCAIILGAWLVCHAESRRQAKRWSIAFLTVATLVGASKLAYMAWGLGIPSLDFIGFSGHSAVATLVWPTLLGVLADRWGTARRSLGMGLGLLLALCVCVSRVVLHAHSVAEVVAGFALGLVALLEFWRELFAARLPERKASLLLLLALVVPLAGGHRFPSEGLLRAVAIELNHRHMAHARHEL